MSLGTHHKICWKKMRMSLAKRTAPIQGTHTVLEEEDDSEYPLFSNKNRPLMANVKLNNANLQMKVDMGATLSIISEKTYNQAWV